MHDAPLSPVVPWVVAVLCLVALIAYWAKPHIANRKRHRR